MRKYLEVISLMVVLSLILPGCNFPLRSSPPTETSSYTETAIPLATQIVSNTPVENESQTLTPTIPVDLPTITNTATFFLLPSSTNTPVSTFTQVPQANQITTGVEGLVTIIKPSRSMPLGGAAITLYEDKTKEDLVSTITILDGSYRFTHIPSGKYYIVLVWVLSKTGAWPCANEKIPSVGKRHNWTYESGGLQIYVEIFTKTSSQIIVAMSTGSFGVSGTRKTINLPLICNQLK